MGYRDIFDDIKKRTFSRLYLFYGEEEYIKDQALNQMVDALIAPDFRDFNYQVMDGSEVTMAALENACETLPFMADTRLVVVRDLPLLNGKRANMTEDDLKSYLSRIPDTTHLVFYQRNGIDKRRSLFSAIKKEGKVISFDRLNDRELQIWVRSTLKKHGKEMAPEDIQYFLMRAGIRLEDLYNEIMKLAAYTGTERIITRQAVDQLVAPTLENTVFQLVESIGCKQGGTALTLLNQLLFDGQPIQLILTMIARQFRLILQCRLYHEQGYTNKDIAGKLKLPVFVIRDCIRQSRNFTAQQLEEGLAECLQVDWAVKNGKMKDRMGVELLIIKMCA